MDVTRRDLLKAGLASAALAALPRPLMAQVRGRPEPVPPITDPDVKELALKAVDAAKQAGAGYADVRLTYSRRREHLAVGSYRDYIDRTTAYRPPPGNIPDQEALHIGVRALVQGYWGFASGTLWTKDEAARLGKEAVALAKVNAFGGKPRAVELAPAPVVRDGHWETPVEIDPFSVSPFEVQDYVDGLVDWLTHLPFRPCRKPFSFGFYSPTGPYSAREQQKAFASSEGSFCTQHLRLGVPCLGLLIITDEALGPIGLLDRVSTTGRGWEAIAEQPIREWLLELMDELIAEFCLPRDPVVQVGRYDTVCDAMTTAALVNATLGAATQLDRALGYEANASGTSYLNDPDRMMGNYQAADSMLTLLADRTRPGGCATVQWDDEGIRPEEFTLIKDGVLVGYQTTRESAAWLKPSATAPRLLQSHGCATSTHAGGPPIQGCPNLTLVPGKTEQGVRELMATLSNGMVIQSVEPPAESVVRVNDHRGMIEMDFQASNGFMSPPPRILRIKDGKPVARILGCTNLFRSADLWKSLLALGGVSSVREIGCRALKGQPEQESFHTVSAPAALFKQVNFIRK